MRVPDGQVPVLMDYALRLTGRPEPRICVLNTAGGDDPRWTLHMYDRFAGHPARLSHLALFPMPNVADPEDLLREEIVGLLGEDGALHLPSGRLGVVLVVGVNGAGKTTTIGKLAARLAREGRKVSVANTDTFRAAAAEQLDAWARRANVQLIAQQRGADPGAVAFDAVESARARDVDVLLVDTAGRLHTRTPLMDELQKVKRVLEKAAGTVDEVLLVLDATTGQNGLTQAREFTKSAGVTGLVLTKLDGTAKGGVVTAIAKDLKIPIRFVGVGEKMDDLIEFSADDFVESLFAA